MDKEEKTLVRLKTIRMICGVVWAICCGIAGVIGGYLAGTAAAPKIIKAKRIWDELTEENEDDEYLEW